MECWWYYQWNISYITKGISVVKFGGITRGIPAEYHWYYQRNISCKFDGITSGIPVEYQWYYKWNISDITNLPVEYQ